MNVKKDKTNNELIEKNQISFCISLISQLLEETELEFNSNSNQSNKNKKILFSIFSLLKFQTKIFQDLFFIQSNQLYNIVQFKQVRNIFDNGKENIKKYLNDILLFSKQTFEKKISKNSNTSNVIYSNNSTTNTAIENKNINNKKKYNTKTFNNNINNYLIKNEERKITNENAMTTIPKSIDITNNNSIPSLHIFKQNKFKKNMNNIKKNHRKAIKNITNKSKMIKENEDYKYKNYVTNTNESKNYDNIIYKSNLKNTIIKTNSNKNMYPKKILVNQINKSNLNSNQNEKKNRNYILSNLTSESHFLEENPVRKVKNIIINAKSLSSLNIDVINQYLYPNKRSIKEKLKNSNSLSSLTKVKIKDLNKQNEYKYNTENKTYAAPFYQPNQTEKKINVTKNYSKERKCNEILIDGMKNIKMKLNSIGKNKQFKKAKSISDLNYIKDIFKNK